VTTFGNIWATYGYGSRFPISIRWFATENQIQKSPINIDITGRVSKIISTSRKTTKNTSIGRLFTNSVE